jgi:hypothetical protein
LKVVGKIDREFIYSFDKDYEHILVRNKYSNYVKEYFSERNDEENEILGLVSYTPRLQLLQK